MKEQKEVWNEEYRTHGEKWKKDAKSFNFDFSGKKVLEIGVGNGKTLKTILRNKADKVIALDFSEKAIEICMKKIKDERVEFLCANVISMPIEDEVFDVAICNYVLNNLSAMERRRAVSEIKRILSRDGIVLFEDFSIGDFRNSGKKYEDNTIVKKNGLICHFFSVDELNKLFSEFPKKEFNVKSFSPLRARKEKREIVHGFAKKEYERSVSNI